MKITVFIATSLDGFIAREDGGIDWLIKANAANDGDENEDYGYAAFYGSIDCVIIGRISLEKVLSFPEWPYPGKRVIVLSNSMKEVPPRLAGKIELYSGEIKALVSKLDSDGVQSLYVDGGRTIQSFLRENFITNLVITQVPILLGEGIPLFGKIPQDLTLKHLKTQVYANGFVKSEYEIQEPV